MFIRIIYYNIGKSLSDQSLEIDILTYVSFSPYFLLSSNELKIDETSF